MEFLNVIGPLTDPRAHGGDPADAFHLVIPSIPGSGFPGRPAKQAGTPNRVTRAFAELMNRLGYDRYGAQGGDTGAVISPGLGRLNPDKVVGVHVNGVSAFTEVNPDEVGESTEAERARLKNLEYMKTEQSGYAMIQITRPQTLAHGCTTPRSGSWLGSWRSSRSGPIRPPNCPRTRWTGICCSPT